MNVINGIKNPELRKALLSHGLHDQSHAQKTLNYLKSNPAILNATEPRMTLYSSEINEFLYSDNSFITKSVNDSVFASSGEIRKLNDSSEGPTVTKGRFYAKSLVNGDPAPEQTVNVRKNTSHDWLIEYFHTAPDALTFELTSEIPYEARQELLLAHSNSLMQSVSDFTAVEWAQGEVGVGEVIDVTTGDNFFLFTSGSTTRQSSVIGNEAAAVKVIVKEDMQALKKALQKQQVINNGGTIYVLPTVEQYNDILNIAEFVDFEKTGRESKLIKGEVGVLYNMTILEPREREDWGANVLYSYSVLTVNDATLTKIEDTAASGASMTSALMAWTEKNVKRAEGSAIVFPWMNSPIYMGDVYASEMRYGATKKRGDKKGVVMLLENPY